MRFRAMTRTGGRFARSVALAALAFAAPALAGDAGPASVEMLRAMTVEGMERSKVRGASLALIRDGRLSWTGSFGVVDQSSGDPVDTRTVFEAASLGKVVSALAALTLVTEGRWTLDMPARSPLLEAPEGCPAPTLAHLLSHSAGLSNDLGATRFRSGCRPGTDFSYAGQGYNVLQELLENETGEPAELFIERRVLRPLGMESSTFVPAAAVGRATGHVDIVFALLIGKARDPALIAGALTMALAGAGCLWLNWRSWRRRTGLRVIGLLVLQWIAVALLLVLVGSRIIVPIEPWSSRTLLASSLHTNVEDLARFAQELLDPEQIDPRARDMLFELQVEAVRGISWGAGIGIDRTAEPTTWWHWGSNPGFQSLLVVEPERGDAIVVLTNSGGGLDYLTATRGGYNLSKHLARRVLGIPGTWDLRHPFLSRPPPEGFAPREP